jgi:hypothetical protein
MEFIAGFLVGWLLGIIVGTIATWCAMSNRVRKYLRRKNWRYF